MAVHSSTATPLCFASLRPPCFCSLSSFSYGSPWSEECNHCSHGHSNYGHSRRISGICGDVDGGGLGQTPRLVGVDAQAMYGADHRSFQMPLATLSLGNLITKYITTCECNAILDQSPDVTQYCTALHGGGWWEWVVGRYTWFWGTVGNTNVFMLLSATSSL